MTVLINKPSVSGGIALIIMGAMFFFISSFLIMSYGNKSKCTEAVSAVVTENVESISNSAKRGRRVTYAPRFEYVYNGETYSYLSKVSTSPAEYSVGAEVTIYVNPNAPQEVYYSPKRLSLIISTAFKIIGVGLAVGGVVMLIVCVVKKKNQAF